MNDELALVRQCLLRDPVAIRRLVEKYQSDVYCLCYRLLNHRQDAEDVCQEVFLRVFRSLHRWDHRRPLRPWIMGITVNRCRTWIAQRGRRPELVDYLHETVVARPEDDSAELGRELMIAVSELRPLYRVVFTLFHDQNLPYEDIAQMMNRPVGTIKTWLHRARQAILIRLRQRGMILDDGIVPHDVNQKRP